VIDTPREPAERVGVFVVRVTHEPGGVPAPVLHMTWTLDVTSQLREVSATTDVEEVCRALRRWLGEYGARAGLPQGPPATQR
jgi:hypothetical protein